MRDLFSGYDYVHMYVHMFRSHLGTSIYGDTRNVNLPLRSGTRVSLICALHKKSMDNGVGGTMFLGDGGWGGQCSMSLCNVRIWRSQVKKQVLNTEKERTRKSVLKHVLKSLH